MRHIEGPPNDRGINRLNKLGQVEDTKHQKLQGVFKQIEDQNIQSKQEERSSNIDFIATNLIPEILEIYQLIDTSIPSGEGTFFLIKRINLYEKRTQYQDQIKIDDRIKTIKPKDPWNKMNTISFLISTNLVEFNGSEEDILNNRPPYSINHQKFEEYKIPKKYQKPSSTQP